MKSIILIVGCLIASLSAFSATIKTTLNSKSTNADAFGDITLSFSAASSADGGYDMYNQFWWHTTLLQANYTIGSEQISLRVVAGAEDPGELNLYTTLAFGDTGLATQYVYAFSGASFIPSHATTDTMTFDSGGISLFSNTTEQPTGSFDFSYTLPVVFDGTDGTGSGSWNINYDQPAVYPVVVVIPEPSSWLLTLLGGGLIIGMQIKRRRA